MAETTTTDTTTRAVRAAYFVSDSTGITAETLGNALLANFPGMVFVKHTVPFVDSVDTATTVAGQIAQDAANGLEPLVFTTAKNLAVRTVLTDVPATHIDLLSGHLSELAEALGTPPSEQLGQFHTLGDATEYFARMRAVEYAIEHDDGQSVRAIEKADVVLIAPSRCGKTPTSMYLALMHGIFVANYPLVDEDLAGEVLPGSISAVADRCFGLLTSPERLTAVRSERRASSRYASLEQTRWELSRARRVYDTHGIDFVDSSSKSVEEMSTLILQSLARRGTTAR